MADLDWLPAREVQRRLFAAGLAAGDLTGSIAWFARHRGLIATGFGRVHNGDAVVREPSRDRVPLRMWRALLAGEKPGLESFASWTDGSLTWVIVRDDGRDLQETWESVHFDRVSVETMVRDISTRGDVDCLQGWEIDRWIETACRTEDSKAAWAAYSLDHGARRGKKAAFTVAWRRVKGERKPGRPRLRERSA
ncbi:hypothetical protein V474_22770 [Novosphingobium barchaimii LL02]|uniref:Uncharacterized protein n=1 Tax=Novosphingobium barchaimii LL02 TaxID=1114963 RepID=A0A0J7XNT8_9SPHN|nr:hypothetical protein [Novosphingobium barchaimii]KMS53606.1 hypothetical protein V474_22770 [Novosphingobium barchaimii LL02]